MKKKAEQRNRKLKAGSLKKNKIESSFCKLMGKKRS